MNRAERRKAGQRGEDKKTLVFHSEEEAKQYVLRGPGQKAMDEEIKRQILEQQDRIELDTDAAILWALHVSCGFGRAKLIKFYHDFLQVWREMRRQYEDEDAYAERYKLKQMGVDVEKLREEDNRGNDML